MVQGTWDDPILITEGQARRRNVNSMTHESHGFHCNDSGGSMTATGGFEVDGRFIPFGGRLTPYVGDTFLYSEFLHEKCNVKETP